MNAEPSGPVTRITFIRHGEVGKRENFYGRFPGYWLGPVGQEQAQSTALALEEDPLDALFASPLLRTRQTAMAIHERQPGVPFATDVRLLEVFTRFDGCPMSVLEQRGYDLYTGEEPPYEQPADVLRRLLDFAAEVMGGPHAGGHVAAVTHGDPLTFLLGWALGLPVGPATRNLLGECGLPESYPGCCAMATVTLKRTEEGIAAVDVRYRNPASGIPVTVFLIEAIP